jgi:MATE family multidrug resistance protein
MHRFRVALFILTVLSKQIMYMMHQPKEVADMAPYRLVAFSLIPDYIPGLQTICGWSSQNEIFDVCILWQMWCTSFFNYV